MILDSRLKVGQYLLSNKKFVHYKQKFENQEQNTLEIYPNEVISKLVSCTVLQFSLLSTFVKFVHNQTMVFCS